MNMAENSKSKERLKEAADSAIGIYFLPVFFQARICRRIRFNFHLRTSSAFFYGVISF